MCVHYQAFKEKIVKEKFSISMVEELLDKLYDSHVFSKLDLRSSFHQIRLKEKDISKTNFRTHEGHDEFFLMPFRLTNTPSSFQRLMNMVFWPYFRKFIMFLMTYWFIVEVKVSILII